MYIDSHAHIYAEKFNDDLDEALSQAQVAGVKEFYMPNIDSKSIEAMHQVEEQYAFCKSMMGLHPCHVDLKYKDELKLVDDWTQKRRYAAIGECGVDLYWDKTYVEEQIKAFQYQIDLAKSLKLAVIIHSRDSLDITIKEIADRQDGSLKGIFHCFNGTVEQAERIHDLGFYIGIGGVVTFKNAGVDKTVAQLPLDNMVLETDAPYLSPAPYRGKRNEPRYIPLIAEKLSELHGVKVEEIADRTTKNCREIFSY